MSQPLVSPTVNTAMSTTPNTVIPPLTPHSTPTTSGTAIPKVEPLQVGLSNPSGISNPAVTTEHMQQLPLVASHISHAQQMAPGQHVGVHMSQQQGMPSMGNFVPGFPAQQLPLNLAMMQPATGAQAPTCQVAVQPQIMPVSSMANQHPVVPGIGQMPVIVSVQPGNGWSTAWNATSSRKCYTNDWRNATCPNASHSFDNTSSATTFTTNYMQ